MKKFKSIIAAVAVLVTVLYGIPSPVQAQSSASLSIVPRKDYNAEPGKTINDTLTIRNIDTENPLDLVLRVVDFTYTDDTGSPSLMLAENAPQTAWSLKPALRVPSSVSIAPGSSKTLDISLTLPDNQGPGSYYSAIVYSSGAADGGNVGLSASGVTLVFASIPGEVNENLILEKFGAYFPATSGSQGQYSFFAFSEPPAMAYTLKNEGNVVGSPVGTIKLKHMFGQEITINDVNPSRSLALIGQSRTFTSCIKMKSEDVDFSGSRSNATACTAAGLWPGYYSANLELYYGQNGNVTKEITSAGGFIYLPWWFIITFLVVLITVTIFIWRSVTAIRRKLNGHQSKKLLRRK